MPNGIQYVSIRERSIITNRHTIEHYETEVRVIANTKLSYQSTVTFPVPNLNGSYHVSNLTSTVALAEPCKG